MQRLVDDERGRKARADLREAWADSNQQAARRRDENAPDERLPTHLTLKWDGEPIANLGLSLNSFYTPFAVAPDGKRIVMLARGEGGSRLFLREMSGFDIRPLAGTEVATSPFFSPDGRWIGFWRAEDRKLWKVSIAGGSPIEIASTDALRSALWLASDEIVIETVGPDAQLWSVPAGGGQPKPIQIRDRAPGERLALRAQVPNSNGLLVASMGSGGTWLDVLSRETGKRRRLLRGGDNSPARYTRSGHLVFADADGLLLCRWTSHSSPLVALCPCCTASIITAGIQTSRSKTVLSSTCPLTASTRPGSNGWTGLGG